MTATGANQIPEYSCKTINLYAAFVRLSARPAGQLAQWLPVLGDSDRQIPQLPDQPTLITPV